MNSDQAKLAAVDIFCGAGGLTLGMRKEGIPVKAGVDLDPACEYAYTTNNPESTFIRANVGDLKGKVINSYFGNAQLRILAGCAPCQPFSLYTQGKDSKQDKQWGLLREFARLVKETRPDVITMENVPRLAQEDIFDSFVRSLRRMKYEVKWQEVKCIEYGIPQNRRRLVLLAGYQKEVPLLPPLPNLQQRTVREAIGHLPPIGAGEASLIDPLHRTRGLSPKNLARIRISKPGGSWREWDDKLVADCHQKESGRSYGSVYGRMGWDAPSPTITTQFFGFGNGRFGHPDQDRAISLREGAILQTFPDNYAFYPPKMFPGFINVGRLIGNAVPVHLARAIARSILAAYEIKMKPKYEGRNR